MIGLYLKDAVENGDLNIGESQPKAYSISLVDALVNFIPIIHVKKEFVRREAFVKASSFHLNHV